MFGHIGHLGHLTPKPQQNRPFFNLSKTANPQNLGHLARPRPPVKAWMPKSRWGRSHASGLTAGPSPGIVSLGTQNPRKISKPASLLAARLALLHAMAAAKNNSGAQPNTTDGARSVRPPAARRSRVGIRRSGGNNITKCRQEPLPPETGQKSPKGWNGQKVNSPRGYGWPDENGNVWMPDSHGGTQHPHWGLQVPGRGYYRVIPPRG